MIFYPKKLKKNYLEEIIILYDLLFPTIKLMIININDNKNNKKNKKKEAISKYVDNYNNKTDINLSGGDNSTSEDAGSGGSSTSGGIFGWS